MSFRNRLILVFGLLLVLVVSITAVTLSLTARDTMLREAERDGELVAQLLARGAGAAERIPARVETLLGEQMLAQARLVAEWIAAAEAGGQSSETITARLVAVVADSHIDEIWVTDSRGHAYLNSAGVEDFVFLPDAEAQPQASEFYPLLTGERESWVQEARQREIDAEMFKYAAVTGVDKPRIVEIGLNARLLAELERELGLEFMVNSLLEGGDINAIWVFSPDLEAIAWGSVLGPRDAPRPDAEERRLLRAVHEQGRSASLLRDGQLVVMAPIPGEDGQWQGVTLLRLSLAQLEQVRHELIVLSVIVTVTGLLLALPIMLLLARRVTDPVARVIDAARRVEQGDFSLAGLAPVAARRDELGRLAQVFQRMADEVNARESWLDEQVQARTRELQDRNEELARAHRRLREELHVARTLQLAILPERFPAPPGVDIHARMRPAREMGGDFYDVFELDEDRIGLVVADVSGKGVPAAFFMAICRTELQAAAQGGRAPEQVLAEVNDMLCTQNPMELFVTVFYGIFDHRRGLLRYANGGHNPPLRLRADGRADWLAAPGGMALGLFDGQPFGFAEIALSPGDTLLLYSDGVTEAFDPQGREYGEARLLDQTRAASGLPARGLIDRLFESVDAHARGAEQSDDLTALVLCRPVADWCEQQSFRPITENLPRVTAFAERYLALAGLPAARVAALVLAVDELFVNIAHHGYADAATAESGEVRITLGRSGMRLSIVIEDDGRAFDPTAQPPADTGAGLAEREIGGLGIHLVREAVDAMHYRRAGRINRLELTIHLTDSASGSP